MPEMINVEEARAYARKRWPSPVVRRPMEALLDDCPRAEVESVLHGRWVQGKWATYPDGYVCDRCSTGFAIPYSHCPNCGAKMDLK